MSSDDDLYDDDFFSNIHAESYASARVVVPRVLGLTGARSVVDIGYGTGAWARACRELGVPEVVGVDGAYVPAERREHATSFIEHNLAEPLKLDRRFGVAFCVEVAEHLPSQRAPGLIADLTAAAPVVVFSAAVPGQGGTGHVNEQWSEYWVSLFEAEGWTCRDAIRPWVRTNPNVAWWYRQNLYLAVAPAVEQAYKTFPRLEAKRLEHPVDFIVRPPGDVMAAPAPPPPGPAGDTAIGGPDDNALHPPLDPAATVFAIGAGDTDGAGSTDGRTADAPSDPAGTALDSEWSVNGTKEASDRTGRDADGHHAKAGSDGAAADTAHEDPDAASPADEPDGYDEMFPQPPGWAAMKRLAGRARRTFGR